MAFPCRDYRLGHPDFPEVQVLHQREGTSDREGTPLLDEPQSAALSSPPDGAALSSRQTSAAPHAPEETQQKHPCPVARCPGTYDTPRGLGRHWVTVHQRFHRRFACPRCSYIHHRIQDMKRHLLNEHAGEYAEGEVEEICVFENLKVVNAPTQKGKYRNPRGVHPPVDPMWVYEQEGLLLPKEIIARGKREVQQKVESLERELHEIRMCQEGLQKELKETRAQLQREEAGNTKLKAEMARLKSDVTSKDQLERAVHVNQRWVEWYKSAPAALYTQLLPPAAPGIGRGQPVAPHCPHQPKQKSQ